MLRDDEEENNLRDQYQEHVAALHAIAAAEDSFLNTIGHLNRENKKLEQKINDADAQNNLLQKQLKVLMSKMENLEAFMLQMNSMKEDGEREAEEDGFQKRVNCPRCGFNLMKNKTFRRSESLSDRDDEYDEEFGTKAERTNPLMIDLIIAKVMSYLPQDTLLKCRLVSQTWQSESNYQLRFKNTFKLNFSNINHLSKFIENPPSSECLFNRLKIDVGFVINPFRANLAEFFETYGPSITHLSIQCEEEFANRIYTEELRNVFLGYLEKIQTLELTIPTKITERASMYEDVRPRNRFIFPHLETITFNQFDNAGGYSVWFTKEMLKMAPNLKSIRVETHNKEVITRVLLALGDRECRSISSQINHLFLDAYITQQHLELLSQFDFQLKSLQLSYFTVEVNKEMIEAILLRHSKTLETLVIGDYQKRPSAAAQPLLIKLPELKNLKTLKFVDPCFPDLRNLVLSPLNYSVQLPNLNKIVFEHELGKPGGVHLFTDVFNTSPTPCLSLKELKVTHGLSDPLAIAQAAIMFPNLERLDVANLSDPVVIEIWANFVNILDLRLELCPANVNVDSLMTGIPHEVCKKIQERNLYNQVEALDVLDIIRTEASICNLTRLRSLIITGIPSTLLTAVTGYLALSQCKSLHCISIKSDVATLSRECRRVLGERLNLSLFELF